MHALNMIMHSWWFAAVVIGATLLLASIDPDDPDDPGDPTTTTP